MTKRNPKVIINDIRRLLGELSISLSEYSGSAHLYDRSTAIPPGPRPTGMAGGLRLLHAEGFLAEMRDVDQVCQELRSRGYIYRREVISVALLRLVRRRVLTRLLEDGVWKYVERK